MKQLQQESVQQERQAAKNHEMELKMEFLLIEIECFF